MTGAAIRKDRHGINSFARFKKPEYWPAAAGIETVDNIIDSPFSAYSLEFDGYTGYLEIPILYKVSDFNHVNLAGAYYNQAVSISFWGRFIDVTDGVNFFNQTFNDESYIALIFENGSTKTAIRGLSSDGAVQSGRRWLTSGTDIVTGVSVPANAPNRDVWHHYVISWIVGNPETHGGAVRIYVNNIRTDNLHLGFISFDFDDMAWLTGRYGLTTFGSKTGSEAKRCRLYDVRFYNKELSSAERAALYGHGSPTTGMVARWNFLEGSGTTIHDVAHTHNGTLYGGVTWSTDHPF